jgi:hypothetical protein
MADAVAVPADSQTRTRAARISVLLLGSLRDRELAPIAGCITSLKDHETRIFAEIESACRAIESEGWHPDLIVALQSWSDQFSPADVLKLLTLAPLARIVCVAGAWCDSDGRTRSSWPIAVRIRSVDALSRIERELSAVSSSRGGAASNDRRPSVLALTASRAEVFEADIAGERSIANDGTRGIVHSPDRVWKEMIERTLGISTSALTAGGEAPDIVVFDADPWSESRCDLLRAADSHWPGARVIACSGDTAIDLADDLKSAGADAVWFKLSPLARLKRLVTMSESRASSALKDCASH